jgi:hypothetical protein
MVTNKSRAALNLTSRQDISHASDSGRDGFLGATESSISINAEHLARKAGNIMALNKQSVAKNHFMKNRIKKYCADSGLPTKEEI